MLYSEIKLCSKCGKYKPISEFWIDSSKADKRCTTCKSCKDLTNKNYYKNNKDIIQKKQTEYNNKNKIKVTEYQKQYRLANKETSKLYFKKRYEKNKQVFLEQYKVYRKLNKTRINKYFVYRNKTDIQFRIAGNLRKRLSAYITRAQKGGSTVKDLGCDISSFKIYLESKFQPGMTWENYGKWHIDHILPLSKFDLTNREQFLQACNYTNLQPLWAEDNIRKSNKVLIK